jgi:hypothetical protein
MMERETAAMRRAVQWLLDHGGSGVCDSNARVLAGGEIAIHIPAETWIRCVFSGLLVVKNGRISIPKEERKSA